MNQTNQIGAPQIKAVQLLQESLRATEMTIDSNWAILAREITDTIPPALQQIGRAGLWKSLTTGRCPRHVFEVPLCIVDLFTERATSAGARFDGLKHLVRWATSTLPGGAPSDWVAPPVEQVAQMLPKELLTVQCVEIASQGRIIRTDDRLSVRFPILTDIPPMLRAGRRKLLTDLLLDAHNSLRMVRVGLIGDEQQSQSAVVELDLTGAPLHCIEPLLKYSVDALHHVVRWTNASAALIASECACEILDQ